jgi:hypothetical protein
MTKLLVTGHGYGDLHAACVWQELQRLALDPPPRHSHSLALVLQIFQGPPSPSPVPLLTTKAEAVSSILMMSSNQSMMPICHLQLLPISCPIWMPDHHFRSRRISFLGRPSYGPLPHYRSSSNGFRRRLACEREYYIN